MVVGTWLLAELTDACDVGGGVEFVEVLSVLGKALLSSCCLPYPQLQLLIWCLPLHLLHFVVEQHSRLMWFFLKHTKHLPVLFKISETSATVLHVLEMCDWRQYEHLGAPDPLVRSELAVRGSLVVLLGP